MGSFISSSNMPQNTIFDDYICDNGVTRPYKRVQDNNGLVVSEEYRNATGSWVSVPATLPATMKYGVCAANPKHKLALPNYNLTAGINTITHNLSLPAPYYVTVEAFDPATGDRTFFKTIQTTLTANSAQITVPVAMVANLTVDGLDR